MAPVCRQPHRGIADSKTAALVEHGELGQMVKDMTLPAEGV